MPGMLMGALAGAGRAMQDMGAEQMKQINNERFLAMHNAAELEKEKRITEAADKRANTAHDWQVSDKASERQANKADEEEKFNRDNSPERIKALAASKSALSDATLASDAKRAAALDNVTYHPAADHTDYEGRRLEHEKLTRELNNPDLSHADKFIVENNTALQVALEKAKENSQTPYTDDQLVKHNEKILALQKNSADILNKYQGTQSPQRVSDDKDDPAGIKKAKLIKEMKENNPGTDFDFSTTSLKDLQGLSETLSKNKPSSTKQSAPIEEPKKGMLSGAIDRIGEALTPDSPEQQVKARQERANTIKDVTGKIAGDLTPSQQKWYDSLSKAEQDRFDSLPRRDKIAALHGK